MFVVEYIGLELRNVNRVLGMITLHLWHNNKNTYFYCLIYAENKEEYS